MNDILYIVVPCYNEQEALPVTAVRLRDKLEALKAQGLIGNLSRILFVDDGSRDATWDVIEGLHRDDKVFSGLKLSRNRGHQNALLAGLMAAKGKADVTVSMDADLQDDVDAVDLMLQKYREGCHVVYGVRSDRSSDTVFKRLSAQGFYKFMSALGVDVIYNHADYRLMSREALDGLSRFNEINLFLRGIVPLVGYKNATVEYCRGERIAGESKYPLRKMLAFAFDGITSFSVRPIRMITALGFIIFAVSAVFTVYAILVKLFGYTTPGWSTLMASIWVLGGLQVLALGIIGEYVGKIYFEVKARPRYIVENFLDE